MELTESQYNRIRIYTELLLLVIICIGAGILIGSANATYVVAQGDIVYMNETVDISLAASWPDFALAWCKPNNDECDPPDQIIKVTGNMHNYLIDSKFNYGTYYRWDGGWHRGENAVAFTIIKGQREWYEPKEETPIVDDVPAQIIYPDGPYSWIIARGDNPTGYSMLNRSDDCYLWVFSDNMDILGRPMSRANNSEYLMQYSYQFSEYETHNISVGSHEAYIQCVGDNRVKDIFMDGSILDTIYDDAVIPDIQIDYWNPYGIKEKFDDLKMSLSRYSLDDDFIPVTIISLEPGITISNVERSEDDTKLFISGVTTWQNQTKITFKLDPEQHKLDQDIKLNTWDTTVSGPINAQRTFDTAVLLEKKNLAIGMHEIVSNAEKNGDFGYTSYLFGVTDVYVMPTPTPSIKRKLYGYNDSEIPVRQTQTPTIIPTKNQISPIQNSTITNESYVVEIDETVVETITPTHTPTKPMPTASQTIPTIPMNPITGILSLCVGLMIWRTYGN